jgi:hypothetical protein
MHTTYGGRYTGNRRVAGRLADTFVNLVDAADPELLERGVGVDAGGGEERSGKGGEKHGESVDESRVEGTLMIFWCRSSDPFKG